jgi:ankyrin repeat protein
MDSGADPNMQTDAGEYGGGNWSKRTVSDAALEPLADRDKTPLHIACEQDDEDMASLLLERLSGK